MKLTGKYVVLDCETHGPNALRPYYGDPATFMWQVMDENGNYNIVESVKTVNVWADADPALETDPKFHDVLGRHGYWLKDKPDPIPEECYEHSYTDPGTDITWTAWYVPDDGQAWRDTVEAMEDPSKEQVGHNTQFDFGHALKDDIKIPWVPHCTYAMAVTLVRDGKPLGLKPLSERFLNDPVEEADAVKRWLKRNYNWYMANKDRPPDYSDVPRPLMVQYGYEDVWKTLRLFWLWRRPIYNEPDYACTYEIDRWAQVGRGMLEGCGLPVDLNYCERESNRMEQLASRLQERLFELSRVPFNPLSSHQVKNIMFNTFGAKPIRDEVTPTGQPSMSKDALKSYATVYGDPQRAMRRGMDESTALRLAEFCRLLPVVRTALKMDNTYFRPLRVHTGDDSIRHYPYFLGVGRSRGSDGGTVTGRLSSPAHVNPKMKDLDGDVDVAVAAEYGLNKAATVRGAFVPGPNETLISNDWIKMEIVVGEKYFRSEKMIAGLRRGDDPYIVKAKEVFGDKRWDAGDKAERKFMRFIGKGLVLGIGYGIGAAKFSKNCMRQGAKISVEQAKEYIQRYKAAAPGIPRMFRDVDRKIKERGWIKNMAGRRYYLDGWESYKGVNYLIQGGSSEIMKRSMVLIQQSLRLLEAMSVLRASIHDEFLNGLRDEDRGISVKDCYKVLVWVSKLFEGRDGGEHFIAACSSAISKLKALDAEWGGYPYCGIPHLVQALMCSNEDWLGDLPLRVDGEMTRSRWSDVIDFDPAILDIWQTTGCPSIIEIHTIAGKNLGGGLWSGAWHASIIRPEFPKRIVYKRADRTTIGRLGLKALEQALIEVGGRGRIIHLLTSDSNLYEAVSKRKAPTARASSLMTPVLGMLDKHNIKLEMIGQPYPGLNPATPVWQNTI